MTPATRTLAWLRQFAKLWGFALFCVLVVYIFREVVLPFLFAILVAYILAPLVDRFGRLRVGGKPFPRAAAVIILYINIIAVLSLFIGYFVPKLSGDFARLFREAPQLFAQAEPRVAAARGGLGRHTTSAPSRGEGDRATSSARPRRAAVRRTPSSSSRCPSGRYRRRSRRAGARGAAHARRPVRHRAAALRGGRAAARAASGSARSSSGCPSGSSRPRARASARSSTARSSSARSWPGSAACSWC